MQKVNLYDIESNLLNAFERRYGYGYITFDTDKRFMGCNDFAKKVFPELNELVIDEHVKPSDSVFYNELLNGSSHGQKIIIVSRYLKQKTFL